MKTLLDLALEIGDSAIAQRVIGKQRYAAHVAERVSQNAQIFPIRDFTKLHADYTHQRAFGVPAWVAMANARSSQPTSRKA